jgi:hypothetical protein
MISSGLRSTNIFVGAGFTVENQIPLWKRGQGGFFILEGELVGCALRTINLPGSQAGAWEPELK